mmetsp:Transcript_1092/g.2280  ORF Transcript_1092/g.2280 Transcript_1092/m.2280 type:complete len:251 (-) Transcript_1092:861-1613(-)
MQRSHQTDDAWSKRLFSGCRIKEGDGLTNARSVREKVLPGREGLERGDVFSAEGSEGPWRGRQEELLDLARGIRELGAVGRCTPHDKSVSEVIRISPAGEGQQRLRRSTDRSVSFPDRSFLSFFRSSFLLSFCSFIQGRAGTADAEGRALSPWSLRFLRVLPERGEDELRKHSTATAGSTRGMSSRFPHPNGAFQIIDRAIEEHLQARTRRVHRPGEDRNRVRAGLQRCTGLRVRHLHREISCRGRCAFG